MPWARLHPRGVEAQAETVTLFPQKISNVVYRKVCGRAFLPKQPHAKEPDPSLARGLVFPPFQNNPRSKQHQ
jgi:hypothetical protein